MLRVAVLSAIMASASAFAPMGSLPAMRTARTGEGASKNVYNISLNGALRHPRLCDAISVL